MRYSVAWAMVVRLRVAGPSDFGRWNQFVSRNPRGNIFQTTHFSRALEYVSSKPFLVVAEDGDELVGGLLSNFVLGNSKIAPLRFFAEARSNYGPIVDQRYVGLDREIVGFALKKMAEMGYRIHYYVGYGDCADIFRRMGYKRSWSVSVASVVDLRKTEEELFRSFSPDHRRGIRKAEKAGLRVEVGTHGSCPEVYHEILVDQARRLGIRPEPFSFIKGIWDTLRPKDMARFYFAYHGEVAVASLIVLRYRKTVHGFLGCALGRYLRLYPWNLLHWRVMQDAIREGMEEYDLMMSPGPDEKNHPHYGLYLFKHGFGSRTVPLNVYIREPRNIRTIIWNRLVNPLFKRVPALARLV